LRPEVCARRHVTAARGWTGDDARKLAGFAPCDLTRLVAAEVAEYVLVEADGSAGRPLKAHLAHEPVLSSCADLVIVVVGLRGIGGPATDEHIHRAAEWCARAGRTVGETVTAEDVARLVFHPEGYLAKVPAHAGVAVFLSQAGTPEARAHGEELVRALRHLDRGQRIGSIVTGELKENPSHG
jgi:probable selenium-dependent hydroxylase accessory protein YqeC